MKSRLAIALVLASNLAAAQPSPVPTAPPCKDPPPSTPAAWERKKVNEAFSLALPACFIAAKTQRRFVHGGTTWECPPAGAEVVLGMWGPTSFGSGDRCTTTIAGVPAVVMRSADTKGTSLLVWYRTGQNHEPLISAWSPRLEDRESVLQIAFSGRVSVVK
jgi:hypothetical protein